MSGGGGKGGSKTTKTETTIPEWVKGPADRNLQRAEAVQQVGYMPYYGPEVAGFTPAQNAAFDANIGAGEAFGLLSPGSLTSTSGMPAPTTFDGGWSGYSSMPLYDQALSELKSNDPGTVAQYDALFGNAVPANVAPPTPSSGGGRIGGGPSRPQQNRGLLPSQINKAKWGADRVLTSTSKGGKGGRGNVGARKAYERSIAARNKRLKK